VLSLLSAVAFVLSCATISFALLALCLRFGRVRGAVWDSLRVNAYGIFVFHFACVTWLQLLLLAVPVPPPVKVALVFAAAVAISWGVTAALRRVPTVAAVL
jgi:hypothetical protein